MAQSRLNVTRTNHETGLAFIGNIPIKGEPPFILGEWQGPFEKATGDASDPHHPESAPFNPDGKAVYLEVVSGDYLIVVAGNGKEQTEVRLTAGDSILLADFESLTVPDKSLQFSFTGHWSVAEKQGARIRVAVVEEELNFELLDLVTGTISA